MYTEGCLPMITSPYVRHIIRQAFIETLNPSSVPPFVLDGHILHTLFDSGPRRTHFIPSLHRQFSTDAFVILYQS